MIFLAVIYFKKPNTCLHTWLLVFIIIDSMEVSSAFFVAAFETRREFRL